MSLTQIRSLLLDLKLTGMHMRLDLVLEESRRHGWNLEESLDALLQAEAETRRERGIRARIQASRLRGQARFEDYDFTASRSLSRSDFREIASLSWLERGQPLVIIGQTGVGKSFLAQAAGFKACALGKTVLAYSVTGWMDERTEALRTGTILKFRKKMLRPDLLQLDDFGLKKLSVDEAEDLREILEDRSFGKSVLLTTQLPYKHWAEVIPDPVLAEAIVDRLEGPALTVTMTGESYRKYRSQKESKKSSRDQKKDDSHDTI
jgi:DNA replication protein DnaC